MRIAIIGCGSIGLLMAAFLARAGYRPLLICRRVEQAALVNDNGVSVQGATSGLARVSATTVEYAFERVRGYDAVLVAVKAYDTPLAADLAQHILGDSGVCVTLQNGLGPYEYLLARVGEGRVAQALLYVGARRISDNVVEYAGGTRIVLGPSRIVAVHGLVDVLSSAGFNVSVVDDVEPYRWEKLAVNAAINPLTAIFGVTNGALLRSQHLLDAALTLAREVELVASSVGVHVPSRVDDVLQAAIRATASNKSSMLQDIEARRQTEVDFINGAVVRVALANGLRVAFNEAVYLLVKGLESLVGVEVRMEWSLVEEMLKLSLQRLRKRRG